MDELRKIEADAREAEDAWAKDAETRIIFGGVPLFVNLNGEETTPAAIVGTDIHFKLGRIACRAAYRAADLTLVEDEGNQWYEINDTALIFDEAERKQ